MPQILSGGVKQGQTQRQATDSHGVRLWVMLTARDEHVSNMSKTLKGPSRTSEDANNQQA